MISFVVEVEGSVTGEGGRGVDVDGGSYASAFRKSVVPRIEESDRTCVATGDGITVDKSRTTVFFRFLAFDGSTGGGTGALAGSVDAPTCCSTRFAGVDSL